MYDVVVFQKRYSRWENPLRQLATFLGKITILDLDDAPSRTQNAVTLRNARRMIQNVSGVTVGSRNLLDYARQCQDNAFLIVAGPVAANAYVVTHGEGGPTEN